jgi:hypothetical protein
LVLAVEGKTDTQFIQRSGKPICYKTSIRNDHATKLNAQVMSTLTRRDGHFFAWKLRGSLHNLEVVLYESAFNKGTLANMDQLPKPWCEPVGKGLRKELAEHMDQGNWAVIFDWHHLC